MNGGKRDVSWADCWLGPRVRLKRKFFFIESHIFGDVCLAHEVVVANEPLVILVKAQDAHEIDLNENVFLLYGVV